MFFCVFLVEPKSKNTKARDVKCNTSKAKLERETKGEPDVKCEISTYTYNDEVLDKPINGSMLKHDSAEDEKILIDYLQLNVNLEYLYKEWAKCDKHFEEISKSFIGIRMLRQNPVECLFSFICSSNNHISRITSMVEKLASNYGEKILALDGVDYFTFPRVASLAQDGVEERLRDLGFGYRAKYIQVLFFHTRLLYHT